MPQKHVETPGTCIQGPPGGLKCLAPCIRELDLADNLLPSWSEAARLAHELPELASLDLSLNCMAWPPARPSPDAVAPFMSLQTLVLNQCCLSWLEVSAYLCGISAPSLFLTRTGSCNGFWGVLRLLGGQVIVNMALCGAGLVGTRHWLSVPADTSRQPSPEWSVLDAHGALSVHALLRCRSAAWSRGCLPWQPSTCAGTTCLRSMDQLCQQRLSAISRWRVPASL